MIAMRPIVAALAALLVTAPATAQDATRGKTLFARCAACHKIDRPGPLGPTLGGVVGRKSASVSGFRYSRAMTGANLTWDEATLDTFLASPTKRVPGTSMSIAVPAAKDRADLIAFLKSLPAPAR